MSRRLLAAALGVALVAGLAGCGLVRQADEGRYRLTARFDRGIGVYPGSPVRVIGINVGTVIRVEPRGDQVEVVMAVDDDQKIPADATATIVPLSLLGERYIQIGPAYQGGPALAPGDVITDTRVPAEFDELLRSIQDLAGAIDPDSASDLVTRMATLLDGQGADINELLEEGAGTMELVADKADEIGDIVTSLADLSATLRDRTGSVTTLLRNYNLLAEVLVENRDDLDATITQLDRSVVALTGLLERHGEDLPDDVAVLAQTGSTLEANIDRLQSTLSSTVRLFQAADRAYEPERNMLRLTNQVDMGLTGELIAARLRDRLAGICRRLGLEVCSDPAAAFFTDLVSLVPDLLSGRPPDQQPTPPTTPSVPTPPVTAPPVSLPPPPDVDALLQAALDQIGALLDESQRQVLELLDAGLLEALPRLTDEQLAAFARLTPDQIETLVGTDPTQLGRAIEALLAADPGAQLDPLLPGGTVDDLVDDLLGALGGDR
jgi:phospholipid/cholesterol/gamma-HCH transport system substrate-binding protein